MSSNMLEQAIIDAAQLKDAALKNAESMILEKYSPEIKEAVSSMLEQPEEEEDDLFGLGMDMDDETPEPDPMAAGLPMAAADGEKACACPDEDEEIEIDFDELAQQMDDEEEDLETLSMDDVPLEEETPPQESDDMVNIPSRLGPELHLYHSSMGDPIYKVGSLAYANQMVPRDLVEDAIGGLESILNTVEEPQELQSLIDELKELVPDMGQEETDLPDMEDSGNLNLSEDAIQALVSQLEEELKVDIRNVANSYAFGATEAAKEEGVEVELARAQDDDVKEEKKSLKKAADKLKESKFRKDFQKLQKQVKSLESQNEEIKSVATKAGDKLKKVNLENAKLLYENRILRSDSLNERQKKTVVDALSKAGSIEEAKVVYETANKTLSTQRENRKVPETLSEHLNKNNAITLKMETKERKPNVDRFNRDKMQRLAGIAKK